MFIIAVPAGPLYAIAAAIAANTLINLQQTKALRHIAEILDEVIGVTTEQAAPTQE